MKIVCVGLGLIGGSLCKAIKKHTNHLVGGIDIDRKVVKMALSQNAIDYEAKDVSEADVTIISLFPPTIISYIKENADVFKEGSVVIDTGGIKKAIVDEVTDVLAERGVTFIGVHPMAGREFSGFEYSLDNLFDDASFIMTPTEKTPKEEIHLIEDLALSIHFKKVVKTSPEEHDRIIAFTSQLAHVVSNAYIKSPTQQQQMGFSAGSFQDLTRVAKLNEDMWTPLFIMNKDALCFEIDYIIDRLAEYRDAIRAEDSAALHELLRKGRILKEEQLAKRG
ncbi:MAG: prephenate dehydrogenase [Oscillospiraceae bacterium]|nr:prephenate dehydrogenase [Oscillospiraceae bacterium]MBR4346383.1 prephenate dehydrogenase [Oscillospiraceae bacterium]